MRLHQTTTKKWLPECAFYTSHEFRARINPPFPRIKQFISVQSSLHSSDAGVRTTWGLCSERTILTKYIRFDAKSIESNAFTIFRGLEGYRALGTLTVEQEQPSLVATLVVEEDWEPTQALRGTAAPLSLDAEALMAVAWEGVLKEWWEDEKWAAGKVKGVAPEEDEEEKEEEEGEEEEDEGIQENGTLSEFDGVPSAGLGLDAGCFGVPERLELSVLLCSDAYIRSLNAEWRGVDAPTDVLSFPQHQPAGLSPVVLLGDVVISVETAQVQAQERGHSLQDELRVLLVHGLLHLLGMDHETGEGDAAAMQAAEQRLLAGLGWRSDGLISASSRNGSTAADGRSGSAAKAAASSARRPQRQPPFRLLLCDMDGTLLNSDSKVSPMTAEALRAAAARGVQIAMATGKARPAAMTALGTADLTGPGGVVSLHSPGVFIQGLRVYGTGGDVVHNALLATHVVAQAFEFALEHKLALVGFSGDHCVTLADHPLVLKLHTKYYEPRAVVLSSVDEIFNEYPVQKLLFYDTEEGVGDFIRPHWSKMLGSHQAALTQAVPEMLEILPPGQSKGAGVKILLDALKIPASEVMALGDGENDKEMLGMVGWGVAMENGSPVTKAVADAVVASNDDGGVVEAVEKYILSG